MKRKAAWLALCLVAAAFGQESDVAAGRRLLASLRFNQATDAAIFRELGMDSARALLMAVVDRGTLRSASAADWKDLHGALNGLIELFSEQGDFVRASIFAQLQDANYRNLEGDYKSALAAAQQALELQQRAGGTDTLDVSWAAIGRDQMSLARPGEALESYRKAQATGRDRTGVGAGRIWRDLVDARLALKDVAGARSEVRLFLEAAQNAPAEFRRSALIADCDVLLEEKQYGTVLDRLRQARADGASDTDITLQLLTTNLLAMRSLDYAESIELAKRMEAEFTGLAVPIGAAARQTIEVRRRMAGDIDAVLREEAGVLEAARAKKDVGGQIQVLEAMAASYAAANSITSQAASLEEARRLMRWLFMPNGMPADSSDATRYFRIANNLGNAYVRLREIGKARQTFQEVTRMIDALPGAAARTDAANAYGGALLGRAAVAVLDDDMDTARDILDKALRGLPAQAAFSRQEVLWQAARLERDDRQIRKAADYYGQAITALEEAGARQEEILARVEFAHFAAVNQAGLPDAGAIADAQLTAAERLSSGLNLAESGWRLLYEKGIVVEGSGDPGQSTALYNAAVAKLESLRANLSQQEQQQSLIDTEAVQDLYRRALTATVGSGTDDQVFEMLERGKARSFLDSLRGKRFRSSTPEPKTAALQQMEKQIAALRTDLLPQNESVLRSAGHDPATLRTELATLENQFHLARQQASLGRDRTGQLFAANPVSLGRVRELLPVDTALLEYGLLKDGIVALVISRNATRRVQWKTSPDQLRKDVARLRTMFSADDGDDSWKELLHSVSQRVSAPVMKLIPAGTTRTYVVAADYLQELPFQALEAEDGHPLIENRTISYLPAASVLEFLPKHWRAPTDVFLGALGDTSVEGWPSLPGTLRETDAIARIFTRAPRVFGAQFTHDAVRDALEHHEAVHFATHGLLDEGAPLFSALLTAGDEGQATRFSLYELADIRIRARLVVLSACETGLGRISGGDEVAGLTRSFLSAGADTVISSLWKVSDDSTAMLMEGLYRRLHSGMRPAAALREAALAVRAKYPHPFYWAPFILTGAT